MDRVQHLVVGAGVSGLSFANAIRAEASALNRAPPSVLVLEADATPGGYCKTITQDGFVWDYSGHFFHFKNKEVETWLLERMGHQDVRTVEKRSFIRFADTTVDFPFQKNIHQLPREDFLACLTDLYFASKEREAAAADIAPASFKKMVESRFGRAIAERFLIPYNEKLYATDLDTLDPTAMGRFFPNANVEDVMKNMREADNASYNASFTYPEGGAIQYVEAMLQDLEDDVVSYEERLERLDLARKVAITNKREIAFDHLVTSAPMPALCKMAGIEVEDGVFTWNKVLCFNLGFDRKGATDAHWIYYPDRSLSFYRVGYYDNILDGDRMSLYVELGFEKDAAVDIAACKEQVLKDLKTAGVIDGHQLVSSHDIILDPAYVHITEQSLAATADAKATFAAANVHPVGRYGGWTYCAIEDNIIETRALAKTLAKVLPPQDR